MIEVSTRRQIELIEGLAGLATQRAREEIEVAARNHDRVERSTREHQQRRALAIAEFERIHAELVQSYRHAREAVLVEYESGGLKVQQEETRFEAKFAAQHADQLEEIRDGCAAQCRRLEATFLEQDAAIKNDLAQFKQQCDFVSQELCKLHSEAEKVVRRRAPWPDPPPAPPPAPGLTRQQYLTSASEAYGRARQKLNQLQHLPIARFLEDGWPVIIFIFVALAAIYPNWLLLGSYGMPAVLIGCVMAPLIAAGLIWGMVRPYARRQTLRLTPEFQQELAQAYGDLAAAMEIASQHAANLQEKSLRRRDRNIASAKDQGEQLYQEQLERYQIRCEQAVEEFASRRRGIEQKNEHLLQQIEEDFPRQIKQLEGEFVRHVTDLGETYRRQCDSDGAEHQREWGELSTQWSQGLADFRNEIAAMNQYCDSQFPAWETSRSKSPASQSGDVSALKIGHYTFDLAAVEGGLPQDERLERPTSVFHLPTVLSYPDCPSLLLEAEEAGRDVATAILQNTMLRLLTTFPPGKVRFTIIDPVGLGQNFSAFMHLADYDEKLVNNRIWTESQHIHQKLADLTEHMENVIQKYLRNEFASIQEYNAQAGEVAEPFQVLVIANFPANFSEDAARRLVSIATSGARCGVYTLISVDARLKLPRNFDLPDLERQAMTLFWNAAEKRFAYQSDPLRRLPLELEVPPDDEQVTQIIRNVGQLAKATARVEVPFEQVIPAASDWWTGDSRAEIEVPLGRAGAKKLQYMRLGKGTSQHVLIAGKTGSGKSTLLNAMITNLAIHYSPTELQFYLIDFKKGVEFKAYAAMQLPHARVIAIESEREFGLSVLDRLDLELKRRGDLFRQHGVQDLKGYRNAVPMAVMPRILLVIDEFQEFFTTDDRISHDSSLLLDRLVRQGRAFGIHVLLGSQTLAGAYSLARSTIGQMAVRIALQCSESDAHLILSEDNTAARLLNRPGEAIYNDANGLFEGNHPFQVVWLSDLQRESYLRQLAKLAQERSLQLETPTVFEGNVAANAADNDLLRAALTGATRADQNPRAWLGSAVAIKEPTHVDFPRQAATNLLIVGQQEEQVLGMLATSMISLAAQHNVASRSPSGDGDTTGNVPQFLVLDGARPDSPEAGFLRQLLRALPLNAKLIAPRAAAEYIRGLATEVERRMVASDQQAEPRFLVIHNLAKFRDLKKSDDFGLASFGDEDAPAADKQLATILREGPSVGVHTMVWCDSYSNVGRWFERSTLRDFDLRVLFQMSANDSANLMDSPAASRLGGHLALLYSEEHGLAEKFRPYGLPDAQWLVWVSQQLQRRISDSPAIDPDVQITV